MSLPEPNFIERDPQVITAEIVAQYELLSGKTLYPAQVESLLINVIAYRETLVRIGIQEAAKQNLVAFARAPMLDYLGELVGVTRLPAQSARTVLRFALTAPLATGVLIPMGTRVEGADGSVTFATDEDATLPPGQLSLDVAATCQDPGNGGNGWQPGQIASLVDEISDADVTVANISVTSAGYDEETDDRLRGRIKLAPESFTNAGSRLAYRFHAVAAHQSIVDVAVLSPVPGEVKLYPLVATGLPDAAMLALVSAACSAENVRPLTDKVEAVAPNPVDYAIEAQLVFYTTANQSYSLATAKAAASAFAAERANALGRDIVPSQLIAALSVDGVYQVLLNQPVLSVLEEHEWARCTGITISPAGVANG